MIVERQKRLVTIDELHCMIAGKGYVVNIEAGFL